MTAKVTGGRADVLLIEDTPSLSVAYQGFLKTAGIASDLAENGADAMAALRRSAYRLVLLDLNLPDMDGFDILRHVREAELGSSVVVVTAQGSLNTAIQAMQLGATDFLVKPFNAERLVTTARNALERTVLRETVETLNREFGRSSFHGFVGSSLTMQGVYRVIESVASSRASVFVTGESGTGKEVCADAIHRAGPRRGGPFVPLNCGAIPKNLIESELFGHVKGAFSGATSHRDGAAQAAHGGTLFLDEICEMDIDLQVKLLRFLQTGKIQKVGSSELLPVDVRIISATNRDPRAEVEAGRFREDLFYRLHVIPIHLPPLRDRDGDILEIAEALLLQMSAEESKRFKAFSPDAQEVLLRHAWPGNVRELQNVVRNAVVLNDGDAVNANMLPTLSLDRSAPSGRSPGREQPGVAALTPTSGDVANLAEDVPTIRLGRPLAEVERDAIERTIALCGGSVPKAALMLGISPSTIYRKKEAWAG